MCVCLAGAALPTSMAQAALTVCLPSLSALFALAGAAPHCMLTSAAQGPTYCVLASAVQGRPSAPSLRISCWLSWSCTLWSQSPSLMPSGRPPSLGAVSPWTLCSAQGGEPRQAAPRQPPFAQCQLLTGGFCICWRPGMHLKSKSTDGTCPTLGRAPTGSTLQGTTGRKVSAVEVLHHPDALLAAGSALPYCS